MWRKYENDLKYLDKINAFRETLQITKRGPYTIENPIEMFKIVLEFNLGKNLIEQILETLGLQPTNWTNTSTYQHLDNFSEL